MQRFRDGLVFKAHRLVYHSTLGLRVIKIKKVGGVVPHAPLAPLQVHLVLLRFRGGLVFKAHRLVYHSTLGLIVIKKRRRFDQTQLTKQMACNPAIKGSDRLRVGWLKRGEEHKTRCPKTKSLRHVVFFVH